MPDAFFAIGINIGRDHMIIPAGIGFAMPDWLDEIAFSSKPGDYCEWMEFDMQAALEPKPAAPSMA